MTTISDLRNAIKRLEDQRETLDTQLANLRGALQYFEKEMPTQESTRAQTPAKAMRNEMVFVLEGAGTPLHYKDIHRRLVERGFPVSGERPENNVNAHLSKDARFISLSRGMWGLKSWGQKDTPKEKESTDEDWVNDVFRAAAEADKVEDVTEEDELASIPF
jgi:DNA-directed RNA polymerase delta subunit